MKGYWAHVQWTHGQTKEGQDQGWRVGMAGMTGSGGGKMKTTILEQQLNK